MIFLINFDVSNHSNFKYIILFRKQNKLYLNVFMYLFLLKKDVYIVTKLLILYLLSYIN
jgi:hypothetical protein